MTNSLRTFPVLAATKPGSSESYFGKDGNINAGSQQEVMQVLGKMMSDVASGKITFDSKENALASAVGGTVQDKKAYFLDRYHDHAGTSWSDLGTSIGAILYETAQRDGFARRLLHKADVQEGSIPRIQLRIQNVTAVVATGPSQNRPIYVEERYIMPPEVSITANPRVYNVDIHQGAADILDDVYARAQEQIMVAEDRMWLQLARATVGIANNLQILAGGITPSNITAVHTAIAVWGLPVEKLLFAAQLWTDIIGNSAAFGNMFDPITKYEIIQTGYIGRLLGMEVLTDGYRDINQRVMASNELFAVASPITHGAMTDRGPVEAVPCNSYPDGIAARGWAMNEIISMVIANSRSVVRGLRV